MKKIKVINHSEIDKTRWDNLVDLSPYSFPYWRSWYLDIVAPGWKAVISGNYEYVLPLPTRKKAFINYVFLPEFTQQLGVFGVDTAPANLVTTMLEEATKKYRYLEFNLNYNNNIEVLSASLRKRKNYELSLNDSYENLYRNFSTNTKQSIRKSQKENLVVSESSSPDKIIDTFIDVKVKQIKHLKNLDYQRLKTLIKAGMSHNAIEIKQIYCGNEFLGGAIFFIEKNRKVFLFSALTSEGRKKRAMFYLIDHVINKNAKSKVIIDFEGSDNKNLGDFYRRFGATERLYLLLTINRLPHLIKWLKN